MTRAIHQSCLWRSAREGTRTPHNHQEMAMNNHQLVPMLFRCSKSSRWRQPPRVTRNLQPRSPSATKDNHSRKCTWNYSQSHKDQESMKEMSGRCLLRLTRMSKMSKCQERHPRAGQQLFITVPKEQSCCPWDSPLSGAGIGRADVALTEPLDRCHVSAVKYDLLISNGHFNIEVHSQRASDTSDAMHRTRDPHTGHYFERSETARGCVGRIRWWVTRRTTASNACSLKPHLQHS